MTSVGDMQHDDAAIQGVSVPCARLTKEDQRWPQEMVDVADDPQVGPVAATHPPWVRGTPAEYPQLVTCHVHTLVAELGVSEGLIAPHEEIDIEAIVGEKQQGISKPWHGADGAHGEEHRDPVSQVCCRKGGGDGFRQSLQLPLWGSNDAPGGEPDALRGRRKGELSLESLSTTTSPRESRLTHDSIGRRRSRARSADRSRVRRLRSPGI